MTIKQLFLLPILLATRVAVAGPGVDDSRPYEAQPGIPDQSAEPAAAIEESSTQSPTENGETAFQLPQIAVAGKKVIAPPSLIVRKVSIEDMQAINAHTVGDALTYVPGVNVQIGGSSGDARAWVRGYRDRDVLVLFDGIPIASGFEGTIDLNEIAVQGITSIDVIKSAPSVIYGTNGVGGVISVVPSWGYGESILDGRVELGSDDKRFAQASGRGGNGKINFALSAQYQTAGDYSLSQNFVPELNQPAGDRLNSDFERSSLLLQLEAQDTILGQTSFFYNLANAEKGLAVEAGAEDPDYERLTHAQRQTLGLSNNFSKIPLSLKLYYNSYDSELTTYTDDSYSEIDDVESAEDYSVGGNLYSTISTSSNNTLVLSAGIQKDVFKAEGELENGNKAELATYTVAVEDEFWITRKLSLAAGGIFVYFDQTQLDQSSSEFNPQLALAWQATDRFSFHASAAERTRFPKLRELYRRRYGNPDLEPQTAINTELGMQYQNGRGWNSDISVFHSKIDGLIERAHRRATYTNFDRVTIDGIEMASSAWIGDTLFLRAAYTYIDASEDLPEGGERQLRSRPKHTAIAELRYLFPGAVTVSFNGIYVSGLYDLDSANVYTRVPSYFVASLKASWAFSDHYEAYLALSNLGDTDYLQRFGDPREGRQLMLGVKFGFGL